MKHVGISVRILAAMLSVSLGLFACCDRPWDDCLRGVNFSIPVSEGDIQILGEEWLANVVRYQMFPDWPYPVDPVSMEEYDEWLQNEMAEVEQTLEYCSRYGLRVIIDLHWTPGGTTENWETRIFYDQVLNDKFISVWETLAAAFKDHPALLGYDLMNEPHQNTPPVEGLDFLSTQERAIQAIRSVDTKSLVFVTPVEGENPNGFADMRTVADRNVVYEVHMYIPHAFTHQGIDVSSTDVYTYPGQIPDESGNPGEMVYYDKYKLKEVLQPVRDFQINNDVQIFVGEFSVIRWAPGAAAYLADCIAIFEEYGWDWAYHDYAAWDGFNLLYESGTRDLVIDENNDRLAAVRAGFAHAARSRHDTQTRRLGIGNSRESGQVFLTPDVDPRARFHESLVDVLFLGQRVVRIEN